MSRTCSSDPSSATATPAGDSGHSLLPDGQVTVHLVNAFAHRGQGGSPTGIVPNSTGLSDEQMRWIAKQSAASHVVFIDASTLAEDVYQVRFFTQGGEIKNCAHATIAAHWFLSDRAHPKQNRMVW
jgi:PhzF family phenazine biosynthesis protein